MIRTKKWSGTGSFGTTANAGNATNGTEGGGGGGGGGGIGGGGGYLSAAKSENASPIVININGSVGSDDGADLLRKLQDAVRTGRARPAGAASY